MKKLAKLCGSIIVLTFAFSFNSRTTHWIRSLPLCANFAVFVALGGVVAAKLTGAPSSLRDAAREERER